MEKLKMLINGQWVDSKSGKTVIRKSPATGEAIAEFPAADVEDVRAAVDAARATFDSGIWRNKAPGERAAVLLKAAALLKARGEEFGRLESEDVGNPYNAIYWAPYYAADVLEYFAGLIRNHCGRTIDMGPNFMGMTVLEPIGVAALITPWNFPLPMASWKLGPSLAVGCSVVLKPSKFTSVTTLKLGEIFTEAGLPAGVLNIVTGSGETVGNELASNHKVDKIAITGSVDTGRTIIRNSAEDIKRISLELGGKSPNIVFADANMEAALNGAMGCFGNAGQVCNAPSRLLLEESIAKEFTEKLVERVKGLKVSMPNDPEAGMGPLISAEHLNKVLSYVDKGVKEGATLACGGKRLTDGEFANGNFMTPAVFTNVTNDMAVAREEIFGPVLVVETFKTTEEAIAIANDTPFGLASGVWTNSMDKANKVARELRAGLVWVNTWGGTIPELPNGGYKQSGYGRELGPEAFENFTQTKAVHLCVL